MKQIKLKTLKVVKWKGYKRHPLSSEYDDIAGPIAENMLEGVKKFGVIGDRPIVIWEGMVLDGWQMYQACIMANTKPRFAHLDKNITAEEYVQIMNDHRRHETPEAAIARIAMRRKRVMEAREQGKTTRQIAEEEKISESQVRKDIDAAHQCADETAGNTGNRGGRKPKNGEYSPPEDSENPESPPEREPGDDTEEIEAEKAEEKARPKIGKPLFDRKKFSDHFGGLVRDVNDAARAYNALNSLGVKGLHRQLEEFETNFNKWFKEVSKPKR